MIRIVDIILSALALIILLPILLLTCIILSLTGEREIFYKQERVGKDMKGFFVLKFATMNKNSPNIGTGTITLQNDPRVLPIGRFLRKTKINELPQLINVILGQMSLIGPRPLTKETFEKYSETGQQIISKNKPGLSGLGSIVFRSEDKLLNDAQSGRDIYLNIISPYKEKLEVWYSENSSHGMYFKLIGLTLIAVLFPRINIISSIIKGIPAPPQSLEGIL